MRGQRSLVSSSIIVISTPHTVAGWDIKRIFSSAYLGPRKLTPTDAVPDPTSKDANVLAAAVYDAAKKTEHKIINGRLEERTDTSIAERDAIPGELPIARCNPIASTHSTKAS